MSASRLTLRVLSYNIHKGYSLGGRRFILQEIREAIRLVQADIVFLQEVFGAHGREGFSGADGLRTGNGPQFEYLAESSWEHVAYGKNAVYAEGHHGNAILSKYAIVSSSNTDISFNRLERRGVLEATIEIPGLDQRLYCFCTHLGLFSRHRKRQVVMLSRQVKNNVSPQAPIIIAGDFNDWTRKLTNRMIKQIDVDEVFRLRYGRHLPTYPSRLPLLALDRIYCRNLQVSEAEVLTGSPWNRLSDHAALFAEFQLNIPRT